MGLIKQLLGLEKRTLTSVSGLGDPSKPLNESMSASTIQIPGYRLTKTLL